MPDDVPVDAADDPAGGQGRKVPALLGKCETGREESVAASLKSLADFATDSSLLLASETLLFGATYTRSRFLSIRGWAIAGIPSLTLPSGC
jgi:hypothetical protein